jgi:hypothetical protein
MCGSNPSQGNLRKALRDLWTTLIQPDPKLPDFKTRNAKIFSINMLLLWPKITSFIYIIRGRLYTFIEILVVKCGPLSTIHSYFMLVSVSIQPVVNPVDHIERLWPKSASMSKM